MSHESAFGRDRQGTVETVRRLALRDGFRLVEVDTLEVDGAPVSSSRIRACIAAGDPSGAERLLGRRYAVTGTVIRDAGGRWTFVPNGPVVRPPTGTYDIEVSWQRAVPDPTLPGPAGLGRLRIDDAADASMDLRPPPTDARGGAVRVELMGRTGEAPSAAPAPHDAPGEEGFAVRFDWAGAGPKHSA
jgi:hypothetical protein